MIAEKPLFPHFKSIKSGQLVLTFMILFTLSACKKTRQEIPVPQEVKLSIDSLQTLATNIPKATYTDLTFINQTTGFAIAKGLIVKTTDGGYSWTSIVSPIDAVLSKIQFTDSQTGYIIGNDGDKGILLKTVDGGQNWVNMNINCPENINGMYFTGSQVGFVTGENFFGRTSDGGQTWTSLKGNAYQVFNDVEFKNGSEGLATASDGVYMKTINGGESWESVASDLKANLGEIYFTEKETYIRLSMDKLADIRNNNAITQVPIAVYKFHFLSSEQAIGIGSHYEEGFWPYGDVLVTNDRWKTSVQKKYTLNEAISFSAIARINDRKIMILGIGFAGTKVLVLNR